MNETFGIEFVEVSKRYVDDPSVPAVIPPLSLAIPRGTLCTLLGPSGCGKTTLLRLIAGLELPSAGRVLIDGRDVTGLAPSERDVGLVFQSYALFPHLSVVDNVAYGLVVSGATRVAARERAREAMAGVGLDGLGERMPSELSGGQQQRVALARALVLRPSVLLFDEPLSNLGARLRRSMRDEIRALQQRLGLTVAYVTHDQHEALAVSDTIVVMERGRIAQQGTPQQLYREPADAFVATFIGEATLFDATRLDDGRLRIGPLLVDRADAAPAPAGAVRVAIRPDAWRVGAAGSGAIAATIDHAAWVGSAWELSVTSPLGRLFVLGDPSGRWRAGDTVGLALDGRQVAVLAR